MNEVKIEKMKNKISTMIYPFDVESIPLIRHNNLIEGYDFKYIISPNGWGLVGKDVSIADEGQDLEINIESNFKEYLEKCEAVLFSDSSNKINFDKLIYPKIIEAAEAKKEILCTIKLDQEKIKKINSICDRNNINFKYLRDKNSEAKSPIFEEIYPINAPVIFVVGLTERTHKFEIQLSIRERLLEQGYNVCQIGSRSYCEIMGFHSFPDFMYNNQISESEKIILFNLYVKKIEIEEKPDLIVIGIPGGTMPFNNKFTNKFGILAYEVSQAILPDVVIFSTLYGNDSPEFLNSISNSYKYKYGFDIDCYNIANISFDRNISEQMGKMKFTTIDWKKVNERIKLNSIEKPVYNIFNINESKEITDNLINILENYAEIKEL